MSQFSVGQRVVSQVDAQGIKCGSVYVVVDVSKRSYPFGTFVTYTVESEDGTRLSVGNGHLVLSAVK